MVMLLVSIIGAAAGVFYTSQLNPLNNYYIFMALFAMIGVAIANALLIALYEAYKSLEKRYTSLEEAQNEQVV
jgi:hypothetical protein